MNEIELIRGQLIAERTHAAQAAHACVAALTTGEPADADEARAFRDTCVSYLVWVLTRFEQRDQLLAEYLKSQPGGPHTDTLAAGLREAAARPGTSRESLTRLEAALAATSPDSARTAWAEFARFFQAAWRERRAAIERQLTQLTGVTRWRAVCAIDADSILEERTRYQRILARLPAGVTLHDPTV